MLNFTNLKKKLLSESNLLDKFIHQGEEVVITENLEVKIDGVLIGERFESLDEAKNYAINFIAMKAEVLDYESVPERVLVSTIEKHHNTRVTHTLLESYNELLSSKQFTIDPVVSELKSPNFFGKYEFALRDGSKVSLSEETHSQLRHLLKDKYDIVEYMKESYDNFKEVVKAVRN
jgi:hypothetical protein